jgi:hypothetical protein
MQKYIKSFNNTILFTTAERGAGEILADLKTIIEGLISQGEELIVSKARIFVEYVQNELGANTGGAIGAIFLVVSDAAISDVVDQNTNDVDTLINAMTAGDFEFTQLTPWRNATMKSNAGDGTTQKHAYSSIQQADFTKQLRRVCKKLIYSAILATNPEVKLVYVVHSANGTTHYARGSLSFEYQVQTKQARML